MLFVIVKHPLLCASGQLVLNANEPPLCKLVVALCIQNTLAHAPHNALVIDDERTPIIDEAQPRLVDAKSLHGFSLGIAEDNVAKVVLIDEASQRFRRIL